MTKRPKYWQPTIKPELKDEILILFEERTDIGNLFGNNPVTFAEDAIRKSVLDFRHETNDDLKKKNEELKKLIFELKREEKAKKELAEEFDRQS